MLVAGALSAGVSRHPGAKCLERLATMRHARVIFGHDDCAVICALVLLLSYRQGPGSGGAGTATGAYPGREASAKLSCVRRAARGRGRLLASLAKAQIAFSRASNSRTQALDRFTSLARDCMASSAEDASA